MTFTITDFLISLSITAIIIFAIKWGGYKWAGMSATPMGCLIGYLIMFLACPLFCWRLLPKETESSWITSCSYKACNYWCDCQDTRIRTGGADTIYRDKKHVLKNDTGRNLVEYMVKYTTNCQNSNHEIIGMLIRPNQYFYWYDDDNYYYMFTQPPSSTMVVTRSRYGRSHQLDFTYLHFLDYAENVPEYVVIPNK